MGKFKPIESPEKFSSSTFNDMTQTLNENAYSMDTPGVMKTFSSLIKRMASEENPKRTFAGFRQLQQLGTSDISSVENIRKGVKDTSNRETSTILKRQGDEMRGMFEKLLHQLSPSTATRATGPTVPLAGAIGQAVGPLIGPLTGLFRKDSNTSGITLPAAGNDLSGDPIGVMDESNIPTPPTPPPTTIRKPVK